MRIQKALIYRASFPNGKSYVGFTKKELDFRKKEHVKASLKFEDTYIFHKAIRKYGSECINWEILEESDDVYSLLNIKEGFYINIFQSHFSMNGYNMTWGGQAGSNEKWFKNLTKKEKEQYFEKLKSTLSKTWNSQNRFKAIKESWNDNRRKKTSERMKLLWLTRDDKQKKKISSKISSKVKQRWTTGIYNGLQEKMTNMAVTKVKGSRWFNDGVKNYRLKDFDPKIQNLAIGRI